MNIFKVSVVVPVYNAEDYLKKSVLSAVDIEEVGEVILVEDKSPDDCLDLCRELENEYSKVKLFQHPDKGNHGAAASRNLGVARSTCEYVAFLDADDYYLPHRFKRDREILMAQSEIDGVYNALGIQYYTQNGRERFINAGFQCQEMSTLSDTVPPEELFSVLVHTHPAVHGHFHTNTITVRKQLFDKVGVFDTRFNIQEDIHLWRRMSAFGKLASGEIVSPVAIRGVHDANRMVDMGVQESDRKIMWHALDIELRKRGFNKSRVQDYKEFKTEMMRKMVVNNNGVHAFYYLMKYVAINPKGVFVNHYFFDKSIFEIFGRNWLSLHLVSWKNKFAD